MRLRSVESPSYHIWTDALHGRELARKAANRWDRGTYVRWTVTSAWTAFEAACEEVLGVTTLGIDFKRKLNQALSSHGFAVPDWGRGLWQNVLRIYTLRKDYVHPGTNQQRLFAPVSEADDSIAVLRAAIRDVYGRVGIPVPEWPSEDEDLLNPRQSLGNLTVASPGADGPDSVRITFVMEGKEHDSRAPVTVT